MDEHIWDHYEQRLSQQGDTYRDRAISRSQRMIEHKMLKNPACKHVEIDGVHSHLLLLDTEIANKKKAYTLPGKSVALGSIVLWKQSHWLITQVDKDDDINTQCIIERCNRQLVWQNPLTGDIHRRWATMDKPYYSNIDDAGVVPMSSREYKVQLPYDEESALIDVDKRFMMETIGNEPKTYRCTSVDSMTERYDDSDELKGFLVLNLTQDQFNKKVDNAELGICDYIQFDDKESNQEDDQVIDTYRRVITYKGDPELKIGGAAKVFSYAVYDSNGKSVEDADGEYAWEVIIPDELSKYIHAETNDASISVQADNTNALIGAVIKLVLLHEGVEVTHLLVKVVALFG